MADGNVGSLFMTLGLKDEISIGLDKVTKKLSSAQKYTDDLQREVGNLRKELKSASGTDISGPFKKSLEFIKKYDDGIYNAIVRTNRLAYALRGITQSKDGKININLSNIPVAIRELAKLNQELNKIDDKDDKKAFKTSISNATDYLKLLQTIERKKAELNEISLSSRNIDKGVIASARNAINGIQQEISKQLFNIQNGSIINTAIMPEIKKLLSMSITEIGDYMRNLKKDNPLSVFANSADMLTSKIATANKKILEMQSLMRSSKIPNLFDITALNGLKGVVGKMQSLINKEGKGEKTDINKINRLVSEYAKLVSQAELAKSTFKQLSREYENANARLVSWFSRYRQLQSIRNDRIRLGLDTSAIDAEISRVRALFSEINTIRTNLGRGNMDYLGMLGSRGTGVDTALYNSTVKAAREEIAERERLIRIRQKDEAEYNRYIERQARNAARLSAERERQNKKESDSALREEYRVRDAKLKTLEREAKARMRTQELADKAAADALKKQQRLDIETMQFQVMLNAAIERRMAAQREEAQLEAKKLSSMSSQEEIQRRFVSYMEQMNAIRPKSPLFNQSGMVDLQRIYGKAFDELGVQYDKLKAKIDSYHGPTDNTGFVAWKNELAVIEAKMQNLVTLSEQAARASVAGTYGPYTTTTKEEAQRRMQESNTLKTAIQERMATEKRAEERRKEAEKQRRKDEKDAAAAEKQRQRDLEITRSRILSVTRTLEQMRDITSRAKRVGIDTTRLESEVSKLTTMLMNLRGIRSAIESGGRYSLGNYGNGNSVGESKLLTEEYRKLVNEKEKAIKLEARHQLEIANTAAKVRNDLARAFEQVNTRASKTSDIVRDLKSLFLQGGLVFGAQQFAMNIIRTGGEIEKQHIAMQSILGDMQNANTMFNQTKELALQSPFTFSELNRDVKQLAAYGVEYENLYDTTKRLADMASGLGVSFERIALAFGQVQARGWLDGKELRQIAYAGIPLLDRLSKYYSMREGKKVTTSDVKGRITKREVSFQDVKNIFWEMTDAGGQFYNMQLTLSETLLGRYNKLKDAWEIMLSDFARGDSVIGGTFKWVLDLVTSLVQQMHTLGPVITAAFAGFAIKKGITAFGSGSAANFLSNKANLANNIQAQLAQGKQISQIERQILLTKNQITNADLRSLIAYQNINKQELRRLYLSGAITTQQYKTSLALMKHVALTNAATASTNNYALSWRKVGVAGMLALNGIGNAIKGFWAAIGGLPGLIVTAATMGIMTIVSKYQDLTQKIKQTQDEILDRRKQVADFTSQNNVAKAVASGDKKEIDNLIESYKEKLKELAPYDYSNLLMKAEEKKSHEERLKYLEQELKLIDKANKANTNRFADNGAWYEDLLGITGKGRDSYSEFMSVINDINKSASSYLISQAKANAFGATSADKTIFNLNKNGFLNYAQKVKDYIAKEFGDISKDENLRRQAIQAMNNIFSAMGVSAENANLIRASVLQAFGIGNDGWLSGEVGKRMSDLISERFPEIALKIKSDQSLNEGEKKKVKELMKDAKSELINQYPVFSTTLQSLLDQSNFKAVIHLVTQSYGGVFNNLQKELSARIPQLDMGVQADMFSLYSSKAETWGKENSWYAARNKAKEEIDKARNEYESAKKSNAPDVNDKYTEYDRLKRIALDLLNYDYEGELKKSNKESKGSKEDEELKRLRNRIELYKKFYSEYKKLQDLVGQGALDKLRKDGEFAPVFGYKLNNITDYESSVRQLLGAIPANTADRIDYKNQAIADIQSKNRELFSEQIAKDNEELSTQLGIISEQYEVYKKIVKLTGDNKGAMSIAFNGGMSTKSYSEYLKSQIAKVLSAHNLSARQNYTLDDVLGMSQSQFNSSYGKNNSRLSVLFKAYREEQNKIKTETINMIADVIEKNRTLEQQLEDINTEYEYQLGLLQAQQDLTPDMRKRAEEGLKKTRDEKTASVQFEIFKRNSDWVTIFDDLDRVSTNTINSMIDKIDTFSKTAGLSVEVVKQLRDALDKLRKESMDRNPFDALFNATSRGNAIGNAINNNEYVFSRGKKAYIDAATAKRTGLKEGEYSKSELENEQTSAYEDFSNAIKAIESKFKSLGDVLSPVISLFEALGMEDTPLAQGMGLATNALSAASGVAGGLNALGLSSLGPYGAAIGAGLSVVSGLFAMHDKALQKEIEASERRQKEMENMTKNIESVLESTLGGIYSYKASRDTTQTLNKVIMSFNRARSATGFFAALERAANPYSQATYNQAIKAQKSGTAYDTELASLMAQKDELIRQRQAEEDKKKTDADAIQNYDQQIKEMEQSISDFTQNFLNDIYSIDLKSWASQLTDAIVEAWAKGEDAADAYHDKVQELMKDLTKNILSQKIMEIALQPVLTDLENLLKQKGRLDETDIPQIADELIGASEDAVDNITSILDALKEQGWDLSENGSLSVSNSIKSITEDTADLLASYLNACRADLSVVRNLHERYYPQFSEIGNAQIIQMKAVAQNTLRNAEAAERIEIAVNSLDSNMKAVINGTKRFNIK